MQNHYDVLEVSHKASKEIIEKAYKTLAKKHHPDLVQGERNKKLAEEKMKKLNEAYEVLSDDNKRANYDLSLNPVEENRSSGVQNSNYQQYQNPQQNNNVYYKSNNGFNNYTNNSKQSGNANNNYNVNRQNYYNQTDAYNNQQEKKDKPPKNLKQEYESFFEKLRNRNKKPSPLSEKFNQIKALLFTAGVMAACLGIMWLLPPTRKILIDFYESNIVIKFIVDAILAIFKKDK
jgi:DnaJ-class molecular chaperone with C-terminal Zn finger domain